MRIIRPYTCEVKHFDGGVYPEGLLLKDRTQQAGSGNTAAAVYTGRNAVGPPFLPLSDAPVAAVMKKKAQKNALCPQTNPSLPMTSA